MITFQEIIQRLKSYWSSQGCILQEPYDVEVGAGTMHPETFFRVLGSGEWRVAYVQPSRRPVDGRYGENPNRLFKHYQLQVIMKPAPDTIQGIYCESLENLGLDLKVHDIRFEEDDWESPTLGAWGIGWQVLCDGLEITQFTYFQQAGGVDLDVVPVEITYGLERIAMLLNGIDNVYRIPWNDRWTYEDVRRQEEYQWSYYAFEMASLEDHFQWFDAFEKEGHRLADEGLWIPAYDYTLKCSHIFNMLDARGAISVSERQKRIQRVRALAVRTALGYIKSLKKNRDRNKSPRDEAQT